MLKHCLKFNKITSFLLAVLIPAAALVEVLVAKLLQLITDVASGKLHIQYGLVVGIVVGYIIIDALFYYFQSYYQEKWINSVSSGVRSELITRYLSDTKNEIGKSEEDSYNQMTNNITMFQNDYLRSLIDIYGQLSQFSIAVVLSIFIQPVLCLIIISLCLPGLLLPVVNQKILQTSKRGVLESSKSYTNTLKNVLEGLETIRLFNVNSIIRERFNYHNNQWLKMQNKDQKSRKIISGISQLVDNFLYLGTWVGGIYFVMQGSISLGQLVAFSQLMVFISEPIQLSSSLITGLIGGKEVARVILKKITKKHNNHENKKINKIQTIQYQNVTYEDNDTRLLILNNINLKLSTSKHYIIVGKTGSGKSTLMKLLRAEEYQYLGEILVNSVDLKEIDGSSLKMHIGVGEQDGHIFNATLKQNLTLFRNKYSISKLKQVLDQVSLHGFANEDGLSTNVSGANSELSGGEMKRLYTARALLDKHQFLIFDEPVSGLDPKTAQSIEQVLTNLEVGWVTITHHYNPKLFKFANEVIVIDNGTIAAEGKVGDPHVKLWLQRLNLVTN